MTQITRKPRVHAEIIKAWADGAEIQVYDSIFNDWVDSQVLTWNPYMKYRIKPEPKLDYVEYVKVERDNIGMLVSKSIKPNIKIVFDGETRKLKSVEIVKE